MTALIVALVALLPFGMGALSDEAAQETNAALKSREAQLLAETPCYPDTVRVIEQQVLAPDTSYVDGIPHVTYRIILCVPLGVDLEGR